MTKPLREPYPPDPDDDAPEVAELRDLDVDAVVKSAEWANENGFRASWQRIELELCRLTGAELGESTLQDIVFSECRLDLVGFRHAKLRRVVFRDCRMGECDFGAARLEDVRFERCELSQANFGGVTIERVELAGCDLHGVVGAASLRGVRMPWDDAIQAGPTFAAALGIELT
jgi:uncharacterized protein YjbI with pentapeptide repeats